MSNAVETALACLFHATVRDTASKCTEVPVL